MCQWFQSQYLAWRDPDYKHEPIVTYNFKQEDHRVKEKNMTTDLLEKVNYGNPNETSLETTNVLTYELGDLVKMLFYSKIYPDRKKFYMIEAKTAMSDLLTQCRVICDREEWDFDELVEMGVSRLIERIDRRIELNE